MTTLTPNQFQTDRFDLLTEDRISIADYRFGRNKHGRRDVWIETSDKGKRFLSQITLEGETYAVRKEIYADECYILREKATGRYYFLDLNDCGFWLHSETFSGAETFCGDESVKVQKWLNENAKTGALTPPARAATSV
ncbi:MAG TPA: hypothetical protein VLM38_07275 [Blastocatellia bacterium]|nr:hypothetical protein [Blastocatellia bacterium]